MAERRGAGEAAACLLFLWLTLLWTALLSALWAPTYFFPGFAGWGRDLAPLKKLTTT